MGTAMSLVLEWVFIRALSLARYLRHCIIYPGAEAERTEELLVKLKTWQSEMYKKGLWMNMVKTKTMVSVINLDLLKKLVASV